MNCQDTILATLVNKAPSTDLVLRLFSNRHRPHKSTRMADLTEVTGHGYKPVTLPGSKWKIDDGVATHPEVEFVFDSAAGKIAGYYITKANTSDILAAKSFREVLEITGPMQKIIISPKIRR